MSQAFVPFRLSGRVPPWGPAVMLAVGALIAAPLGLFYGYVTAINPLIYVGALITIAFGALVGAAAAHGARLGKVRSLPVAALGSLGVTAVAQYVGWIGWFRGFAGEWIVTPEDISLCLALVLDEGAWSVWSFTPTGPLLATVWIAEALIVTAASVGMTYALMELRGFCEACDRWTEDSPTVFLPHTSAARVRALTRAGDLTALAARGFATARDPQRTEVVLSRCEGCRELHLAQVTLVGLERTGDGTDRVIRTSLPLTVIDEATWRALGRGVALRPATA